MDVLETLPPQRQTHGAPRPHLHRRLAAPVISQGVLVEVTSLPVDRHLAPGAYTRPLFGST